jgi:hypothetical protein
MESLLKVLKQMDDADPEIIGGVRLDESLVECVDLSVADSPVLPHRSRDEFGPPPSPAKATKLESGDYWVDGMPGTIKAETLRWWRGRFLLTRDMLYKRLRSMGHGERQRVVSQYFGGQVWLPKEGSDLAKAMGV